MGDLLDAAKTTYAAGPSSDPHEPVKGEIIALFSLIESIIGTTLDGLLVGNAVLKSTRALLYADLAHAAGTLGLVYNDSTAAYNGYYLKSGASGAGSWAIQTSLSLPSTFAADLADAIADIVTLQADVAGKMTNTIAALTSLTSTAAAKVIPISNDGLLLRDSEDSLTIKRVTVYNFMVEYLNRFYASMLAAGKSTLVSGDIFGIFDSEASSAPKRLSFGVLRGTLWTDFGLMISLGLAKTTPVDADAIALSDSAALNATKKVTWANVKVALKAYFDTVYQPLSTVLTNTTASFTTILKDKLDGIEALADVTDAANVGTSIHGVAGKTTPADADTLPLIDSAASNILKKLTWANVKVALNLLYQPLNARLTSIASLTTNGTVPVKTGSNEYTAFTVTQFIRDTIWPLATATQVRDAIVAQPRPAPGNTAITNAVRNVFAANGLVDPGGVQGGLSIPFDTVTYPYLASAYAAYGHPNGMQITHFANGVVPAIAKLITPEELAAIGLTPSDVTPPTISIRVGYQNNSRADEVRVALQYSDDPLTAIHSGPAWVDKNVLFIDAAAMPATGYLGEGDTAMWNHTADSAIGGVANTQTSVRHQAIKVPATYGGKPFKGIKLIVLDTEGGTIIGGEPRTVIAGGFAVIRSSTMDMWGSYINPVDEVRNFSQPEINEIERMATEAAATGGYRSINLDTVPRILLGNNSLAEAAFSLKKKFWGSTVSLLTDWNIENMARSGDDYIETFNRVVNDTSIFGSGARSMPAGYVIINDISNAAWKDRDYQDYWAALRRLIKAIMSLGAVPILMSEPRYGELAPSTVLMGLSAIAREHGIEFWNVSDHCRVMEATRNEDYYLNNHGGTRTQQMIADFVARKVQALPRPSTSLKIFRRRSTLPITSLRYDTAEEKARVLEEINIGHTALATVSEENFDSLSSETINVQTMASEYLALKNGSPISIPGIAVIEAVLPGSARNVSEVTIRPNVSGSVLTYYVRKALRPLGWTPEAGGYQAIETAVSENVAADDVYEDSNGQDFTIEGKDTLPDGTNVIAATPYVYASQSAQTFTKISGAPGSTASFASVRARPGQSAEFYQSLGTPWANWVAITAVDGLITINDPEILQECIIGDKISIAIVGNTTLTMLAPEVRYRGVVEKFFPAIPEPVYLDGTQKLAGTLVTDAEWTTVDEDGVDLGAPTTAAPSDGWLPAGITEVTTVSNSVRLRQSVTLESDARRSKSAQVMVRARYAPAKVAPEDYGSSPITPDTVDVRSLVVLVNPGDNTKAMRFTRDVKLAWDDVLFDFDIPVTGNLSGSYRIEVYCEDGSLQLALVELWVA